MNEFFCPPFLEFGDTVGIVSTARKISETEVQIAVSAFESWGLKVIKGRALHNICNQFAGTDEERAADMQEMLNNPEVKAIVCARGGYGTVRIIDRLDFSVFTHNPKWIVGYSDVTVLHSLVHNKMKCMTMHATMPINFPQDNDNFPPVESLKKALFGNLKEHIFDSDSLNRNGNSEGVICGGNLSILYSLRGTPADIDTDGKILFIEDLDEYLYHIDRMMMNLKYSGKLKNLKGLIIGGLSDMKDNTVPYGKTAQQIVFDAVKDYDYPVCFNFPAGHITYNMALILGSKVSLEVKNENCKLIFH